jgi:hypothetical protein
MAMLNRQSKDVFLQVATKTLRDHLDFSEKQIEEFEESFNFTLQNIVMDYLQRMKEDDIVSKYGSKDNRNQQAT